MSGVGKSITFPGLTGTNSIDGILTNRAWGGTMTYAFPAQFSDYGNYPASSFPYESSSFQSAPASILSAFCAELKIWFRTFCLRNDVTVTTSVEE